MLCVMRYLMRFKAASTAQPLFELRTVLCYVVHGRVFSLLFFVTFTASSEVSDLGIHPNGTEVLVNSTADLT